MGVFIVEVELLLGGEVGLRFIVLVVCAEGSVVGDGGVEGLARCERGLEFGALGGDFGVTESEGTAVEVVTTLAGLSADHGAQLCGIQVRDDGMISQCPVIDVRKFSVVWCSVIKV